MIRGADPEENPLLFDNSLMKLRSELKDLEQKEFILDQQKLLVERSITHITEDCRKYPFLKRKYLFKLENIPGFVRYSGQRGVFVVQI